MTQNVLLGEIAEIQTGPFGSQLHQKDYVPKGTPIITVEHLGEDRISKQNLPRVSNDDRQRLKKYWLAEGDTVFSRVGSVDRASYVHRGEDGWLFSGRCLRVHPDTSKVNPRFLSFQLRSPAFVSYIKSIAVGATMPSINTKLLATAPVVLPSRSAQDQAAEILDAIESKIELNRLMNETLEQMGKALFKHRFIANPEAENWEVLKIKDVSSYISRGVSPQYDENGSSLVVNQRCIRDKRLDITNARRQSRHFGNEKLLISGDVLINSTGVGTLGRVAQVDSVPEDTTFDSHVTVVRPDQSVDKYFFGELMRSLESLFAAMGSGTTGQTELSRVAVGEVEFKMPPQQNVEKFGEQIKAYRLQMLDNEEEVQVLITLRDSLLPRLISGKIKVE